MHPILIDFKIPIYSYGTMVAAAFFLGLFLVLRRAKELNIAKEFISDLFLIILLSGIAGARLLYVAINFRYFIENPLEIIMVHHGGLVLYGGVITAFAAGFVFIKKKGMPFLKIADLFVPYLALGQALGRIGCYLNGCCFGKITFFLTSVVFPRSSLPYHNHLEKGFINDGAHYSLPVHPVQLYSALLDIAIFMVLLHIDRKKRHDGITFWSYLILYPLKRFFVEFIRGDTPHVLAHLTLYQIISAGLLLIGAVGYALNRKLRT